MMLFNMHLISSKVAQGKEPACQCRSCRSSRRRRFDPWVRKIPLSRNGNQRQYSCLKKSHGQRDLVGYGARVLKVTDMNECVCILALRSKIDICINIEILEKGNPEKCIMIRR